MSQAVNKLVEVGVVLQGGGALGAYECGALNALLELIDEFSAKGHRALLKVVSGVSIGSINAACVVGAKSSADARDRLNAMWDDLMLETPPFWMHAAQRDRAYFGLPGFYTPRAMSGPLRVGPTFMIPAHCWRRSPATWISPRSTQARPRSR